MAGTKNRGTQRDQKAPVPNAASQRRRSRGNRRAAIFSELVMIAAEQGAPIKMGVSTADALQECLDRAVALWRFAASRVDAILVEEDPDNASLESELFEEIRGPGGSVDLRLNRWIVFEREARQDVEKLAGMMTQLGIAERSVRIQEAQAMMMVSLIKEAAVAADIPPDQVRALGSALRQQIETSSLKVPDPSTSSFAASQSSTTSRRAADAAQPST